MNITSEPKEGGIVDPSGGAFDEEDQIEIKALANEGFRFKEWQGDLNSSQNPLVIKIDSDVTAIAVFEKKQYSFTVSIEGGGSVVERIVQQKTNDYDYGTIIELEAYPDDEWVFTGWQGDIVEDENPTTITVTNELNISAIFGDGIPNLITNEPIEVEPFAVTMSGEVISDNGARIIQVGFCLGESPNPTVEDIYFKKSIVSHAYELRIAGLKNQNKYYIRSCVLADSELVSEAKYYYGDEKTFITEELNVYEGQGATDLGGNFYKSIVIGDQEWFQENLSTTKYQNRDDISNPQGDDWENTIGGAWAVYGDKDTVTTGYGRLYNWYAVTDERGICPAGWRVPNESDWQELELYLGMNEVSGYVVERGQDENIGGKLKEAGTSNWFNPNEGANNISKFSALPAGIRGDNGFDYRGDSVSFWTYPNEDENTSERRSLAYNSSAVYYSGASESLGFSVRCIKN